MPRDGTKELRLKNMATEELKIRITADTQDVESSINKVKRGLGGINGKEAQAASKSVSDSMKEMRNSIESLRNMTALDMLVENLDNVKKVGQSISGTFKDVKENLKITFSNLIPSAYENGEWKGWKRAFSDFSKDGGFSLKSLKSDLGAVGGSFKQLFNGIIPAGAAAAVAAIGLVVGAVVALVSATKNAIRVSERLRATFFEAHKVGLTTASYEELSYVLGQVGVGADKLSDFIKSLSAAQNDMRDGSEGMVNAFKTLGLSVEEATAMTQEELFVETIKRLQQMEDGIERTGIAYRIFGEDDAAEVANLLALNNQEMERMIDNFYLLGGSASDSAVKKSLELQSALSNLRLAWQGLSTTFGEIFMPMITAVVNALAKAVAWINMFTRALFGMDIVSKGSKSVNQASSGVKGYSDSLKSATKEAEKLKRSTMGFDELNIVPSGKSAAGGADSSLGAGAGGGSSFALPEISGLTKDLGLDKMAAKIEKWKGVIQTVIPIAMVIGGLVGGVACLFTGNFIAAAGLFAMAGIGIAIGNSNGLWTKLGKGLVKIWEDIKKKFKKILDDISKWWTTTWNNIKKTATNIWNAIKLSIVVTLTVWKKLFTDAWTAIKNGVTTAWNKIKKFFSDTWTAIKLSIVVAIAVWKKLFTDAWTAIKNGITTAWNNIKKFFSDTWNAIKAIQIVVWTAIKKFFSDTWEAIKNSAITSWNNIKKFFSDTWDIISKAATTAWNAIKTMFETTWNNIKTKASELCESLKKSFSNAWTAIKNTWDVVKGYFSDIWNDIKNTLSPVIESIKSFFSNAWTAIKGEWNNVKGYFRDIWNDIKNAASPALESIKGFFSNAWTSIKNTWSVVTNWFSGIWTGIKNVYNGAADWFGGIFGGAVTKIKNAWSGISGWFSGIWSGIKGVFTSAGSAISDGITGALKTTFNSFMSGAVGLINKFIRSINSAIKVINKIPKVNISTIGELSVPQLAKGGIVTGSILANIGERGREAVLPLENNTGWMDALADKIAARNGGSTKVVLQVNDRELGYATIEAINAITRQTGGLQLAL